MIAHWDEVDGRRLDTGPMGLVRIDLGDAIGSRNLGLARLQVDPGKRSSPVHVEGDEEEIFVVLDGDGVLELWPSPQRARHGTEFEEHPIRAGHVISRPAGTGIAHSLRSGERGLTYLAYGYHDRSDVCYYPRSNKIFFRGVGLIARLEDLDYYDGEPS